MTYSTKHCSITVTSHFKWLIREKGGCQRMQWHKHKVQPYFSRRPMNSQRKWQRKSQLSDFSPCQPQAEIQAEKSEKQRKSLS